MSGENRLQSRRTQRGNDKVVPIKFMWSDRVEQSTRAMRFLLFLLLPFLVRSDTCTNCTTSGGRWCVDANAKEQCHRKNEKCTTDIKHAVNCPQSPNPGYAYDENFARNIATPMIGAVYAHSPVPCLKSQMPTITLYLNLHVQCRDGPPNSTCHAYVAYDTTLKAIMVVFEGTNGNQQWKDEIGSFFEKKQNFFGEGNVYAYFYNAFFFLWNGGLETAVRNLHYLYPDYQLWAFGHSLGASICTVFASYTVKTGMWPAENVKLVTFGQPRTGDHQFAMWHDSAFLYSYRVVHKQDPVPHVPPMLGPDEVFHHRYEVWYNNDMSIGQPYTVCAEADGPYCSNTQTDNVWEDHVHYFDKDLTDTWANAGCPK